MNLLSSATSQHTDPQCLEVQKHFFEFLNEFIIDADKFYVKQAELMHNNVTNTLYVDYSHFGLFFPDMDFGDILIQGFYRYEPFLRKAVHQFMFKLYPETKETDIFYVSFYRPKHVYKIRDLKTSNLGKLLAFVGTITRTTEVRPELVQGSFMCMVCNKEVRDVEQQFRFTEPKVCKNSSCHNTNKWQLQMENSVFCDFQKLRVQENSNEIPAGGMPRSIDVIIRNEMVDKVRPGEKVLIVGMLAVVPDLYSLLKPGEKTEISTKNEGQKAKTQAPLEGVTGLKSLGVRDLNYKMVFIANYAESIHNPMNKSNLNSEEAQEGEEDDKEALKKFSPDELEQIELIKSDKDVYSKMAKSIAPAVTGHASEEIKKGILLMLFGGVNKRTREGISLRGDINICIVGDPSTAKSQFLKFVCSFVPRSVYTSGKATSASGLTASVLRDPDSGEFCIEAGALMLADNGVCCIDEFDKMEIKDQVAIHEAMEQQTISLAKAGIHATLNARASILAAANPIFGRYDKSKSLRYNLDISAPILSRFDLFFVVLDECNEFVDHTIASHIVNLHRKKDQALHPDYTVEQMQKYLRFAKLLKPQMTREAAETLKNEYIRLRVNDATAQKTAYRITVRQLESLVRLSEALARVHGSEVITSAYVKEGARLLSNSILKVEKPQLDIETEQEENVESHQEEMREGGARTTIIQEELKMRKDEEAKRATVKISYEEFEKMAQSLIYYLTQRIKADPALEENGVPQSEIVNWYAEENFAQINTVVDANKLTKICHSVIQRLITQEKIFIIVKDDPDYTMRMLTLHSNYTGEGGL